ncbi:g_PROTEIN_RECEP_F1_2 domain-containing protein [Caerostris darwini]|uniref:G_PROTEIN_RECEP_F1_2 domain-containing protein n=1 Tax=Caerostris darwini TaxID=1538125 RepID=A0AAV4R1B2_9ARAC|nr:g_PROTEIN_RECEP_F1_2 domain-containing protein [Caerostris darwini]
MALNETFQGHTYLMKEEFKEPNRYSYYPHQAPGPQFYSEQFFCLVIKMLILVIILFLLCCGPRLVMHAMIKHGLNNFTVHMYNMRVAAYLLSFTHSAINPIIYGFMSTNFRKMMLQCCKDSVCCKVSCSSCGKASRPVVEEHRAQRRTVSDSYEFSTLTTSTRRSRQANSVNVEDAKMKRNEEQWTAV